MSQSGETKDLVDVVDAAAATGREIGRVAIVNNVNSTLAQEKEVNAFFRLHSPTIIARLREAFPDLPDAPDSKTVFLKLRELRNQW